MHPDDRRSLRISERGKLASANVYINAYDHEHSTVGVAMSPWWTGAVGYEVYLRSFADSDGDGVGDLPGLRSRLDYLADLGVDVVWITPFYPSPQADHGYDVADYLAVDPQFGTLADLTGLADDAHQRGMRVVIDLVANHTSSRHPWFLDSRSSRQAARRNWYVWRDPAPGGGPPNNWLSYFGGPAWTFDEATGQYWMHLFLPEQPDLNWSEPAVHDAVATILDTWLSRGVDGVRIDVAHCFVEDSSFRDNPTPRSPPPDDADPRAVFDSQEHLYDIDQPAVLDIYRRWRAIAERYDAVLLGEVFLLDPDRLARYVQDDGLHLAFCFDVLKLPWSAAAIRSTLERYLSATQPGRLAWPLSSHDDPRAVSRFGGGQHGRRRALAYLTFLCGLPGSPWLMQGDELGLADADLAHATPADPIAQRNPGAAGRDAMRTPMPWEPGHALGFTTGTPWMPLGANRTDADTVAVQQRDPNSPLMHTRTLMRARREVSILAGDDPVRWIDDCPEEVVAFRRSDTLVALNTSAQPREIAGLSHVSRARIAYASADDTTIVAGALRLSPDTAAIVVGADRRS